jgi:hypothetical protein
VLWFGTVYESWVPGFGMVSADTREGCQRLVDRILSGRENWPGGV